MFLRRALEKDPAKRVRDVGDVRLALDGAFDETTDDRDTAASGRPRLRAVGTWMAAALLGAASTGLVVWTTTANPERRAVSFYLDPPEGSEFGPATMLPRPALSPDGRQLAFIARLGATQAIWVQTLGDVRARPLRGTEGAESPFWSPDGRSIAFGGARPLSKIAASGEGAPQELCACGAEYGGSWGTDGTIVFADADGVFRVSADGGEPVRVAAVETDASSTTSTAIPCSPPWPREATRPSNSRLRFHCSGSRRARSWRPGRGIQRHLTASDSSWSTT
jgi:serine/threonine-protein kinase